MRDADDSEWIVPRSVGKCRAHVRNCDDHKHDLEAVSNPKAERHSKSEMEIARNDEKDAGKPPERRVNGTRRSETITNPGFANLTAINDADGRAVGSSQQ